MSSKGEEEINNIEGWTDITHEIKQEIFNFSAY